MVKQGSGSQELRLEISSGRLDAERLDGLARDLVRDLRGIPVLTAETAGRTAAPHEKAPADIGLTGQIVLTFLSAGAASALINCLKAYLERDRTLRLRFKRHDGSELEIEGKHFDPKTVDETLRALERLVPASPC